MIMGFAQFAYSYDKQVKRENAACLSAPARSMEVVALAWVRLRGLAAADRVEFNARTPRVIRRAWRAVREDKPEGGRASEMLEEMLVKYQDPSAADKILKIQRELDDTKVVLHKTIDSVLARGEKLDNLVDKSTDLSLASQMFYKQAKKQNQCCTMM